MSAQLPLVPSPVPPGVEGVWYSGGEAADTASTHLHQVRAEDLMSDDYTPMNECERRRFDAKVDKTAGSDACWEWTAATDRDGYGSFHYRGQECRAHRVALSAALGRSLRRLALHHCDNPSCVNPGHLYEGNRSDNIRDCMERSGWRPPALCGASNGRAKLDANAVRHIRHSRESDRALGRRFGVSGTQVRRIRNRECWASVP